MNTWPRVGPQAVRWTLAAATLTWCAALLFAAATAARPDPGVVAYVVSATTYAVGALLCHQRPERSFHVWGAQIPVCARCVGIYAGAACAAIASLRPRTIRDVHFNRLRLGLALAAIPTAATLVFEWTTGIMPSNSVRASAGWPLGAALMWAIIAVAASRSSVEVH